MYNQQAESLAQEAPVISSRARYWVILILITTVIGGAFLLVKTAKEARKTSSESEMLNTTLNAQVVNNYAADLNSELNSVSSDLDSIQKDTDNNTSDQTPTL